MKRALKSYKPAAIRTWFLSLFCIICLVIFALLLVGAVSNDLSDPSNTHMRHRRQAVSTFTAVIGSLTSSASTSSASPIGTSAPNPNSFVDPGVQNATAPNRSSFSQVDGSAKYFVGSYLPTLAAILLSIIWSCTAFRLKEAEPFFQMSRPEGAKARDSLCLDYAKSNEAIVFLRSLRQRHWSIVMSSLTVFAITVCTAFASEVLFLTATGDCRIKLDNEDPASYGECFAELKIRPWLAWIISVVVLCIAISSAIIAILTARRRTGLRAEAASLAGIGALYHPSLDSELQLGAFKSSSRLHITQDVSSQQIQIVQSLDQWKANASDKPVSFASNKHKKWDILLNPAIMLAIIVYLAGIITMIAYYRWASKPGTGNKLEDFLDSDSFGERLLFNVLGLSLKLYWARVHRYIYANAPYLAMSSKDGATATKSILLGSFSHATTALLSAATWRSFALFLVTTTTVLSEMLVVSISAVPYSTVTSYVAFEASVYISISILGFMIFTVAFLLAWTLLNRSARPMAPESLAEALALLQGSNLVPHLNRLSTLHRKERDTTVKNWKWAYTVKHLEVPSKTGLHQRWRIMVQEAAI